MTLAFWFLFLFARFPLACPSDMAQVGGVCIDRYEAPNEKGALPLVMQSFVDAERWCEARGKRTCTEDEWEGACRRQAEGRSCNNARSWIAFDIDRYASSKTQGAEVARLFQGSPGGSFETCRTPEGVFDLDGNVEEWVRARKGRPWRAVLKGGFWAKGWPKCWEANDAHEPTFRFFETGFRCCKDTGP